MQTDSPRAAALWAGVPVAARALVTALMDPNERTRPTAAEAGTSLWLQAAAAVSASKAAAVVEAATIAPWWWWRSSSSSCHAGEEIFYARPAWRRHGAGMM